MFTRVTLALNGEWLSVDDDAGRYCLRCGDAVHPPDPPHLCADVQRGLDEAIRRAEVPCQGRGTLEGWLRRMDHYDPHPRRRRR